jgi:hypothetical protein
MKAQTLLDELITAKASNIEQFKDMQVCIAGEDRDYDILSTYVIPIGGGYEKTTYSRFTIDIEEKQ